MPAIVLVGAQWGDEGKGKATDQLGGSVDYVVKFNGGNNAGHTVVIGEEKYALHLLPSGILTEGVVPVIANGVVVDIEVLFDELDALTARGVDVSKLRVSANAHIITHYHRTLDKVTERFLGKKQIGTTGRGIGPAYADKINRVGIRMQDLFDEGILRQKVEAALDQKNHLLVKVYNRRAILVDEVVETLLSYTERLRPMVCDTSLVLNRALDVLGLPGPNWLTAPSLSMLSVIVVAVWVSLGHNILLFATGLNEIDESYYEAAQIDGADPLRQFWHVTVPLLRPTIVFVLITNFITALSSFALMLVLTEGGPARSTTVTGLYMYEMAFSDLRLGRASATAYILFAIILVISLIQLRILRRGGVNAY